MRSDQAAAARFAEASLFSPAWRTRTRWSAEARLRARRKVGKSGRGGEDFLGGYFLAMEFSSSARLVRRPKTCPGPRPLRVRRVLPSGARMQKAVFSKRPPR
ncbi:MAG: hypothetical protein ACSHYF_10790 [Verrucomicrobiaceae bacterium]